MYIQYQNDQIFFTLQCEFFTSCNVLNNASPVSARTGGGGGGGGVMVNQMWTDLDRGTGVPNIPKFVRTSFMDDPCGEQFFEIVK